MAGKRDVILLDKDNNLEIYPCAHANSDNEVINDTYARKDVHEVSYNITVDGGWSSVNGYYVCTLTADTDERIAKIKATDVPTWDVDVDPTGGSGEDYKTQIKYRAYVTTLVTGDGKITLYAMKEPGPFVLHLKGVDFIR